MVPNLAVHVIQRGNNRSICFPAPNDYEHYLSHLRRNAHEFGCAVHAYCLMPNHVHLLLTPRDLNSCARLMKRLGQLQAQYINGRYKRTGTLWEGRFKSSLVQSQSYVLACYRYIELNPVRAGIVGRPDVYAWSSYAANALGKLDPLVVPHPEYLALGGKQEIRHASYRQFFAATLQSTINEEIRSAASAGLPLGTMRFKETLSVQLGRRTVKSKPGPRPPNEQLELLP